MPEQKKKKGFLWLYVIIWIFTAVAFAGVIVTQFASYNGYRNELEEVRMQIAAEETVHEDLLDQQIYNESDAYIEQQAREQLGLIRPDEIVLINDAE